MKKYLIIFFTLIFTSNTFCGDIKEENDGYLLSYKVVYGEKFYKLDLYFKKDTNVYRLKLNDTITIVSLRDKHQFSLLLQNKTMLYKVKDIDKWVQPDTVNYLPLILNDTIIGEYRCKKIITKFGITKNFMTIYEAYDKKLPFKLSLISYPNVKNIPIKIDMSVFSFHYSSMIFTKVDMPSNISDEISIEEFYKKIDVSNARIFRFAMGTFQ